MEIVIMLLIGALAGWLGSLIFRHSSLGVFGNVIIAILGSTLGYWIFGEFGINFGTGITGPVLRGVIAAIGLLIVVNLFFSGRKS
jgi:uncharacterized membrane protein YeaQ/YmgE (transglycosylase-associated protein family)